MKLRPTAPPTKDDYGKFWWVKDNMSHGRIVPVKIITWRAEMSFSAVGYCRMNEMGWTAADDNGVTWYGPVDMPEEG